MGSRYMERDPDWVKTTVALIAHKLHHCAAPLLRVDDNISIFFSCHTQRVH